MVHTIAMFAVLSSVHIQTAKRHSTWTSRCNVYTITWWQCPCKRYKALV